MSLGYLQTILPPSSHPLNDDAHEDVPLDLSDHELGVVLAHYQKFLDAIHPYKNKLAPIQTFLGRFDAEINKLADSLQTLQLQAEELSSGLQDHRLLVDELNPVILDLMIPPSVAELVLLAPIDKQWVENIHFIWEKSQFVASVDAASGSLGASALYQGSKALDELKAGLAILEAKAIERIRNHIIEQIRLLRRSPKVSSQKVQISLLEVKEIYVFLKQRRPKLASQLLLAYIYTMKWYYTTRFAKYLYSLQKLKVKAIDLLFVLGGANDLLETKLGLFGLVGGATSYAYSGASSNAKSPGPLNLPSVPKISLAEYFLSVPKRMQILSDDTEEAARAVPSQIAETSPFSYWLEFAFNQFSIALHDNVIVEYLFVTEFFYGGSEKFDLLSTIDPVNHKESVKKDWSHAMFETVFDMGRSFASWLVSSPHHQQYLGARLSAGPALAATGVYNSTSLLYSGTCDAYAILLMIRVIQHRNAKLHNQFHVPVMDDYHNSLLLLFWPSFTKIIDLNCDSLKRNVLGASSYAYGDVSFAPINTTQQFSQFLVGLLKLAHVHDADKESVFNGEPLRMSITRLRNDFESFLTKTSTHMMGNRKSKAEQKEMFLFNNYFLIITILKNEFEAVDDPFIQEQVQHFELLCQAHGPTK